MEAEDKNNLYVTLSTYRRIRDSRSESIQESISESIQELQQRLFH